MRVIVGLGNPGEEYRRTRHNIGFLVIDNILSAVRGSRFEAQGKFNAEVSKTKVGGEKVILVKPMTFMNRSGEAVRRVVEYYQKQSYLLRKELCFGESLFIVHDELDLQMGRLKIQQDMGAAGHHGVESVIEHLGTKDFVRFRVGVGRNKGEAFYIIKGFALAEDYLLSDFTKKEMEVMLPTIEKTAEAVLYALENGVEKAMNKYN